MSATVVLFMMTMIERAWYATWVDRPSFATPYSLFAESDAELGGHCIGAIWVVPRWDIWLARRSNVFVLEIYRVRLVKGHRADSLRSNVELDHVAFVLEVDAPCGLPSRIKLHSSVTFTSLVRVIRVVQDELLIAGIHLPH